MKKQNAVIVRMQKLPTSPSLKKARVAIEESGMPGHWFPKVKLDLEQPLRKKEAFVLATEMVAGYRELRASAVKMYDEMLKPLNDKRQVILKWKRENVESIDAVLDGLSVRLREFEDKVEKMREGQATKALAVAEERSTQEQADIVADIESALEFVEDEETREKLQADLIAVKKLPPPLAVVMEKNPASMDQAPITGTDRFSVKVMDHVLLAKAVVKGGIPPDAIQANQPWLNAQARKQKTFFSMPGCELTITRDYKRKGGHS
jgi:hypothetical protein